MISSIAWVPAGVADPSPKRYELSQREKEMIIAMEEKADKASSPEQGSVVNHDFKRKRGAMRVNVSSDKVANELPADLRMDEYSSDEDGGTAIGQLLIDRGHPVTTEIAAKSSEESNDESNMNDNENDMEVRNRQEKQNNMDGNDAELGDGGGDDDDDVDDDDIDNVPDMREFMPIDVDGLDSMGMYNVGLGGGADMEEMDYDDDGSEAEDVRLTDDDAIVLVAKTEEDFSSLEVHVYDQKQGMLYVHHDIPLPSFPLCLAHGQVSCDGNPGNFCAVGTFDTGIELWNLDVLNALEPSCTLGGEDTSAMDDLALQKVVGGTRAQSKPAEYSSLRPESHKEAVMALSWNSIHKQVIASGSADTTVKLWDVTQAGSSSSGKCNAATFEHHKGKVQSVVWHPKEGTLLATGSYDKTVALLDARSRGRNVKSVKIPSDCEVVAWDPFHPEHLTVGTEDGTICSWDVRKFETSSPLWTVVASEFGGVTDLSFSPHVSGLFATSSVDKRVTLWNLDVRPRVCGSRDMCAGKLYSVEFYASSPLLLACGGSGNSLSVWDIRGDEDISEDFSSRLDSSQTQAVSSGSPKQEDLEEMMAERTDPSRITAGKKKLNSRKEKKKPRKRRG